MSWHRVDDDFYAHPKVQAAGVEAIGLWTLAASWSCKYLTGGLLTKQNLVCLDPTGFADKAKRLVESGLWIEDGDAYRFHDWDKYHAEANAVAKKRSDLKQIRAEAGRKGALARLAKRKAIAETNGEQLLPSKQANGKPNTNTNTKKSGEGFAAPLEPGKPDQPTDRPREPPESLVVKLRRPKRDQGTRNGDRGLYIAAFEQAAVEALGQSYVFPATTKWERDALDDLIDGHSPSKDIVAATQWLQERVSAFVRYLASLPDERRAKTPLGAESLTRWLNAGAPDSDRPAEEPDEWSHLPREYA